MGEDNNSIQDLEQLSRTARRLILQSVTTADGGHLGGPLSAVDVLISLYFSIMAIDPEEADDPDRDRFVLSKGHSSIALYTVLAMRGYFPIAELSSFDAINSRLQGHPDMTATPGVDMSSGSLGLGFSAALGIAMGARIAGRSFRTYAMLGDGECNEGIVWEAAHVAARYNLDSFIGIVDVNRMQQQSWVDPVTCQRLAPYEEGELRARWAAFGWRVIDVDGHDHHEIHSGLQRAGETTGRPSVVLAHTVKGKGVSFMEHQATWHSRVPTSDELTRALEELTA